MSYSAEERSYIWLDSFPFDVSQKRRLLNGRSAVALVKNFATEKPFFEKLKKTELYEEMLKTLSDGGAYFKATLARFEKLGILCLPCCTQGYPSTWRGLADAPLCVYAKGNAELLESRVLTAVGSRRTTDAAAKLGAKIAEEVSNVFTLATGVADGGDGAVIKGALKGSGRVICLLAGGLEHIPQNSLSLLSEVEKKGLILSPFFPSTPVLAYSYEYRNKLLAILSEGTFVLSAGEKSGALITAKYAQENGKPVFAFPYPPNAFSGVGCNALLKKGAFLTENSVDILGHFGINFIEKSKEATLSETEERVWTALKELGETHVTVLSQKSGVPAFKLTVILSSLEVKGLVAKSGGNRYVAI